MSKKLQIVDKLTKQADWNQNDETAADYVKNRPFYTGDTVLTEVVPETTATLKENKGIYGAEIANSSSFTFEVGTTYIVNWNGTEYTSVGRAIRNGINYVGDASLITGNESTGEPFFIAIIPNEVIILHALDATAAGETRTFSISTNLTDVHKIDVKYFPDGYPYTSLVTGTLVDNVSIEVSSDGGSVSNPFSLTLEVGETYPVTWDENTYECVAYNLEGIPAVGNATIVNSEWVGGNNEPFLIGTPNNRVSVYAQKAGIHTISISGPALEVHPMDVKFVPTDSFDGFVRYDISQSLTTDQQNQVIANIRAVSYNISQSLTTNEKNVARTNIGAASSTHNQAASTISAGTFAGQVVAESSNQTPSTMLIRNSKLVSTETNPSNNGEICWLYE